MQGTPSFAAWEPVAFGATSGLLHGAAGETGIVICDDWGFDAQCSRRAMRILADRLAAKGYPVLRYDHPGMGESLPRADDVQSLDDHRSALHEAIATLRQHRGVERVLLIGLGYGTALSLDHLKDTAGDVAGLVLMAPVLSGRGWLRELQLKAAMIADVNGFTNPSEDGIALTIAGLKMPTALAGEIKSLRFSETAVASEPATLVLTRPGRANETEFADRIAEKGAGNTAAVFDGYDALMTDPTQTVLPEGDLETVTSWIEDRFPAVPLDQDAASPPAASMAGEGFTDTLMILGRENQMVGTWCEPATKKTSTTVLVFSAGGTPRSGWAGQTRALARSLANRGIASLRLDVSDIGDSRPISSGEPIVHYSAGQIADAEDAVDLLKARGADRIVASGACSGAYLALRGAIADHRITNVVSVNLQRFLWDPRDDIAGALRFDHTDTGGYARKLFTRSGIVKILSGSVPVFTLVRHLVIRTLRKIEYKAARHLLGLSTFSRIYRQVHGELQDLGDRGVTVDLIFGEGDHGVPHMEHILGTDGERAAGFPGLDLTFIENADHNLTPDQAREIVRQSLLQVVHGQRGEADADLKVAAE